MLTDFRKYAQQQKIIQEANEKALKIAKQRLIESAQKTPIDSIEEKINQKFKADIDDYYSRGRNVYKLHHSITYDDLKELYMDCNSSDTVDNFIKANNVVTNNSAQDHEAFDIIYQELIKKIVRDLVNDDRNPLIVHTGKDISFDDRNVIAVEVYMSINELP